MPTLVWIRRSESGPDADDATSRRRGEDAAIPDPVVSAASAADAAPDVAAAAAAVMPPAFGVPPPAYGVPPTFTTQTMGPYHHHHHHHHHQHQQHHQQWQWQWQQPPLLRRHVTADDGTTTTSPKHDGRRKKRTMNLSAQGLGLGVYKTLSGKFQARIRFGSKYRHVGTFDTPEQASAAFMSVRKDLWDAKLPPHESEDSGSAIFDEAKKQALESFGGFEREFPRGVGRASSGRFRCSIQWGGKSRYIGTFDTPEQASAVFMSVRKDLDDANLSAFGADETDTIFDAAKKKARESIKGNV